MREIKLLLNLVIAFAIIIPASAQEKVKPNVVKTPIGFAISKPLKDAPIVTGFEKANEEFYMNKHRDRKIDPNITAPDFSRMPVDPDEQKQQGWINNSSKALNQNFAGQNSGSYPPDCNGTVGPNHYFQVVNVTYAIYNKSDGSIAAGPSNLNTIFDSSLPGANYNNGDPIVLWDEHANRWFYSEFSLGGSNDYMLIAVSTSADPTGTWYSWSYDVDDTPDYMKFGIWQDGYYMATNTGNGDDVYAFERDAMIAGDPNAQMIGFDNPNRPSTFDGFHCIMPLDNDGPWAPSGTPAQFITIADDGQSNPSDALYIYELDVDWNTPANSTFARTQTINVNSFSGNFNGSWDNIVQPGTNQKLDGISTVLMYRAQYRNFGGTQKIVCTHTIAESSTESAIRWYELENTGSGWSIAQQGTYNPDAVSRWNASIAMNDIGQIGLGYSVSDGSSTYPGIRYTGQTTTAPSGVMDVAETNIWTGTNSQTSYNRWGDYANISIDPSDGETFWFTSEYMGSSTHGTRIAAFTVDESISCTPPSTQASNFSTSAIGDNSMTISWNRGNGNSVLVLAREGSAVSSDPVSGNSYTASSSFGSGSQIGSGNYVVYNGTGTSVNVSGLSTATSYHYAVYEYNTSDNCYNYIELAGSATTTGVNYCTSQGNNSTYEWISGVTVGSLTNNSGAANYTDFTSMNVDLAPGSSYNISLTPGFASTTYNEYWKIWIDYNKNGSFDDAGELAFDQGGMSQTVVTGSITIPSGLTGSTRMRVSMKYNGAQTSCEAFDYGEVEDYTVTFTGTGNVAPIAEANGPYNGTAGTAVSFSSSGSTDSDGTITGYSWNFGDGGTSTSANPSHTYASAGNYTATLTVTDNGGLTDSDNASVSISASNVAPTAEANGPYSGTAGTSVSFSSAGSTDTDGTITSYSWNFGDGGTSSSANPSHTYASAGNYTATLTVTDNGGLTDSDNASVSITSSGGDYATLPYSTGFESGYDANWSTQGENSYSRILLTTANTPHSGSYHLTMDVTTNGNYNTNEAWMRLNLAGESQVDLDFWWKDFSDETHAQDGVYFSDNGGATFVKVQDLNGASYANNTWNEFNLDLDQLASANGLSLTSTFVVKFQQYDNYSITTDGMAFDDISVSGGTANIAPTAEANGPYSGNTGTSVSFSSAGSNDTDGTITSYSWNFGDGGTSTSANPSHTYTSAGNYTATLTITDNGGLTDSDNASVSISASNVAPTAEANGPYSGTAGTSVSFSSAGSTDTDGTITSYSWNFGDGGTSSSANPSHTYASAGNYTATLTVTDNGGLTDSDNASVSITSSGGDYATLPYSTGFESGYDANWSTQGENSYSRILLTTANTPHNGSYHLTMDVTTNGNFCQNEAWMRLNLAGESQVDLDFWWKDFSDETHAQDGVYFSDDGGTTFVKVQDLNGASYANNTWNEFNLDLDQLASANGLSLTSTFVVKFQQYDNYAITTDGMAFDDISVSAGGVNTDHPTGYCASAGGNSSYEWIDLVQLGSINNSTGNDGGYADYTSMSTDLINGTEYTINFSCGFSSSSYTEFWHVFIDYNRDGDFTDAGEEVATGSSSSDGTLSGTFTVPSGTSYGHTRMRVTMKWDAAATSCESFSYGEVEDYDVFLTPTARSRETIVHNNGYEIGFEESMHTLYPNPTCDIVNIKLPKNSNIAIRITNINGKEVKALKLVNRTDINISDLPSGIYLVNIDDGRKTTVQKLVKY